MSVGALAVSSSAALAAPKIESLVCQRSASKIGSAPEGGDRAAADLITFTTPGLANEDGTLTLVDGPEGKGGIGITDNATKKTKVVHSKDKHFDCDTATAEGKPNAAQWAGNDLVLAKGSFCEEFASKPYLINARKGKFLSFLKIKGVSPEAVYHIQQVDKTTLAIAVWEHNDAGMSSVLLVNAKTGAVAKQKKFSAKEAEALPACK
jgi:hypothetical protein